MAEFKFISVQGGAAKPVKVDKGTRSHAIRSGIRKSSSRSRDTTSLKATEEYIAYSPKPRVQSIRDASFDPFDCLPVPMNREVGYLVKYLFTKFRLENNGADRKKSWLAYALQSSPMMHSTLAMSAALWQGDSWAVEQSIRVEGMRQKGEAMQEISKKLMHVGTTTNDAQLIFLMSTISTLAITEVCYGEFRAAEIHLHAVRDMFKARGGFEAFKEEFILCKAINLADIQVATVSGRPLTLPLFNSDQFDRPESVLVHSQHHLLNSSVTGEDFYGHTEVFSQVRQLLSARQSCTISIEHQRTMLNVIDDAILRHLYGNGIDDSAASRRSRALVLATQVFVHRTGRCIPSNSPVVRQLCTNLQKMLETSPLEGDIWVDDLEALLWIAFVGLLGRGVSNGQWFLRLFTSIHKELSQDLSGLYYNVRTILASFLWDESPCQLLLLEMSRDPNLSEIGNMFE